MPSILARSLITFLCVIYLFMLTGCGTLGPKSNATIYDRKGVDVLVEPTTGISYLLTDEGTIDQFCMAPPPDLSDAKGSAGSLAVQGVSVSKDTSVSVATLGGRSPAVLISREIMYRTCEFYVNLKMSKQEAISLFRESLDRVIDVTKTQIARGTQTQISSSNVTAPLYGSDGASATAGYSASPPTGNGFAPPPDGSGSPPTGGYGPPQTGSQPTGGYTPPTTTN